MAEGGSTTRGRSVGKDRQSIATLRARLAVFSRWAMTEDRRAATLPARTAFLARFERQVDPDGRLEPAERARRAEFARSAYMARLAMESAKARRRKAVRRDRSPKEQCDG
jgi:hypothetical protein